MEYIQSRRALPMIVVAAAVVIAAIVVAIVVAASGASAKPQSYIIVYKNSVKNVAAETDQLENADGGFQAQYEYASALKGFAATLTAKELAAVKRDPDVLFISKNYPVEADALVPLKKGGSLPTDDPRVLASRGGKVQQASSVSVAVIDTGVSLKNPALNVVAGKNCLNPRKPPTDTVGHGTHVAGIIGAKNNGRGVVGVVPGTRIIAVKVLGSNGGSVASVICGINWVTANARRYNIKVANMSLGGTADLPYGVGVDDGQCGRRIDDPEHVAICDSTNAGITYVVAAGNDGSNYYQSSPAGYSQVLTVTAITDLNGKPGGGATSTLPCAKGVGADDSAARFSDYPNKANFGHTVAAPGVCIKSTWLNNKYVSIDGTSMASPVVAGVVAACFGEAGRKGPCSSLKPPQVIAKIIGSSASYAKTHPSYEYKGESKYGPLIWIGAGTG